MLIRPAGEPDLDALAEFIEPFVAAEKLLPRTKEELCELIEHGFVAESENRIVGFVTLEVYSRKLAEIRSLAVDDAFRGEGLGRQLVACCVERARELNVLEVMAITSAEQFFEQCGFHFTLPGEKKALFISTRT
jgi:N-acetylglutamate synthase-like GNAT family acetyltransferase